MEIMRIGIITLGFVVLFYFFGAVGIGIICFLFGIGWYIYKLKKEYDGEE